MDRSEPISLPVPVSAPPAAASAVPVSAPPQHDDAPITNAVSPETSNVLDNSPVTVSGYMPNKADVPEDSISSALGSNASGMFMDPAKARNYQLLMMAKGFLTPARSGAEALGNAIGNYGTAGLEASKMTAEQQARLLQLQDNKLYRQGMLANTANRNAVYGQSVDNRGAYYDNLGHYHEAMAGVAQQNANTKNMTGNAYVANSTTRANAATSNAATNASRNGNQDYLRAQEQAMKDPNWLDAKTDADRRALVQTYMPPSSGSQATTTPNGRVTAAPAQRAVQVPSPVDRAKAAIAAGAPRDAVISRLKAAGVDTSGL